MKIQSGAMPSIDQLADQYLKSRNTSSDAKVQDAVSFQEILNRKQLSEGR